MNRKQIKKIIIAAFVICFAILLNTKVYAATMGMSINKTSAYVGDSFSVTISGINGRVNITGNSNVSLSVSGSQWVDGSLTITGTAKSVGTGTITVTPVDASTTAAEPEEVTASASRSITIKEKETPPTTTTTPQTTTTNKSNTSTTNKATTTTTPKEETKVEDNFYISKLVLKGVKENGEVVDIELTPGFNKDTYEYTCNVSSDIQKVELEKEAGEYTNSIIVNGLDELQEGENIITLMLSAENHEAKTYTIKLIKEKQEEVIETVAEVEENINKEESNNVKMISMPIWVFVIMQILIIVVEVIVIQFIPWRNLFKKKIDIN